MKLITESIEKELSKYPLYSQDGKGKDAVVVCKFFNPCGSGTWYVLEGEKEENDWLLYGIVELNGFMEYGYFKVSQLEELRLPYGLTIERDLHFKSDAIKNIDEID